MDMEVGILPALLTHQARRPRGRGRKTGGARKVPPQPVIKDWLRMKNLHAPTHRAIAQRWHEPPADDL